MDPVRKQLTLPSGATTTIRRLSPLDFAGAGLVRPNTVKVAQETDTENPSEATVDFMFQVSRLAVLKACGHIVIQGRTRKIVDKDFFECGPKELCLADLDAKDFHFIATEVCELSGFGKEAAEAAQTFPEKPGPSSDSPPVG